MLIFSLEEAKSAIRQILKSKSGRVLPTPYCRKRMLERQVFMDDIDRVLFWGSVRPGKNPGDAEANIFRIMGEDCEDEPLTLVIQIVLPEELIIVFNVFGEVYGQS